MGHPRDTEWIELAAGRLDESAAAELRRHLAACPDCRRRSENLAGVWDQLGEMPGPPPGDLTGRVLAAARDGSAGGLAWPMRRWVLGMARAAAVVAVSVTGGYLAGRWHPTPEPAPVATRAGESETHAAESLYLGVLIDETPVGLAGVVLEPADGEERQ